MDRIRIGIISPSDIAYRRFMPGLLNDRDFVFSGVAIASRDEWPTVNTDQELNKAQKFIDIYGGRIFHSYIECIESNDIDAIYIPLPPLLHAYWGIPSLKAGKHLLLEKPFTTSYHDTKELIELAKEKNLAVHENYAFLYHKRMTTLYSLLADNCIGSIRLIRADFGFPYRGSHDFRYHKSMGGGAFFDCGGYPLKLASQLLGDAHVISSALGYSKAHDVDVYGSATLLNRNHTIAQIGFGMDNFYRCDLEIWGENGYMVLPRIFSPTADMETEIIIKGKSDTMRIAMEPDDQFAGSIRRFHDSIINKESRMKAMHEILSQSTMSATILSLADNLNGEPR